jgi:hypothetical protein
VKAQELKDYLTYVNYRANRGYTPEVTPEQWEKVYGQSVYAMEEKYQAEKAFVRMEEAYWDSRANT